ncbi:MAG: glycoside hydrolase [Chlorobiaceae bacterium]|nr:glycoside hydrolase [Chlorobiaceae bacterium]
MPQGYLIFHLNLAFSSIAEDARPGVIRKCYWPLLDMVGRTGIPVGIELTGWTLKQISLLDPSWIDRFKTMLADSRCELIGSGWSQIIGPLVPYEVNRYNQRIGLDAYRELLDIVPAIVLVNEMAFSTGMVDIYADAGYVGIVMDRDNVRFALGLEHAPVVDMPYRAKGSGQTSLPVLWSDSILFQRLQRVIHGDIPVAEYVGYVARRAQDDNACLPIYCNDAEIFDYRPGRFSTEASLHPEGEWNRMSRVLQRLETELDMNWLSPSAALTYRVPGEKIEPALLSSTSQPIPVKKQAKYNVNRWAVTGRDDLWLNTMCHRIHRGLLECQENSVDAWRELCELWASDLRTHITQDRWQEALDRVDAMLERFRREQSLQPQGATQSSWVGECQDVVIEKDEEDIYWTIKSNLVQMTLNVRRGLAISALAFREHGFEPVLGTLPQGYFSSILLGADFYSGGILIELPGERNRMTDLERVVPQLVREDTSLSIRVYLPIAGGELTKILKMDLLNGTVTLHYDFTGFSRPMGIIRAGILTLLPEAWNLPIGVSCINGGQVPEEFVFDGNVDHGKAATTFVSSSASLGATDGRVLVKDSSGRALQLKWDPSSCAAAPMLQNRIVNASCLTRIYFSLCELDDTFRPDGRLLPFSLEISASKP